MWIKRDELEALKSRVRDLEREVIVLRSATHLYVPDRSYSGTMTRNQITVDVASVVSQLVSHLRLYIEHRPSAPASVSLASKVGPEKGEIG